MTVIANVLPPSVPALAGAAAEPQRPAATPVQSPETPAVIVSITEPATSGPNSEAQTNLQYAISGVNGWIFNYNNADYAKIAARDGADAAVRARASLLQGALSGETELLSYAAQHGLSTGAPITFDAIKADPQADSGSALQAAPAAAAEVQEIATAVPSSAPFSAASAGADVALATLTSPSTPAAAASAPPAIDIRFSKSV